MKTAEEILDGYGDIMANNFEKCYTEKDVLSAMKEYAEEVLDEASKKATGFIKGHGVKIDKESILKVKYQLK